MISPSTLLFLFPLDFVRLYWIVTPFDIIAIIYCGRFFYAAKPQRDLFIASSVIFIAYTSLILISGLINSPLILEHVILFAGTALSITKAVALLDAIDQTPDRFADFLLYGYLAVNIAMIFTLLIGVGYSGSGRFSGFFNQTNGMAAFQTFAFATGLFAFSRNNVGLAFSILIISLFMIILSGSRGSLVALPALVLFYASSKILTSNARLGMLIGLAMIALLLIAIMYGSSTTSTLGHFLIASEYTGAQRIGGFLNTLNTTGALAEFEQSRGNLNEMALGFYLDNPTLFGFGYDSSAELLRIGNRPHNIFTSSLIELGFLGFAFFACFFLYAGFLALRSLFSSGTPTFFGIMLLAFSLQAMKTPYYFLNGISWALIIFAFRASLGIVPAIVDRHHAGRGAP